MSTVEVNTIKPVTGNTTTFSNTTESSSSTTGSVVLSGGVGIAKKVYLNSDLNVAGNTNITGNTTITTGNLSLTTGILKENIVTKSAAYIILDNDGYNLFYLDASSRAFTITLPTVADNAGRKLFFNIKTAGGCVTIDGEGAETIGGYATLLLYSANDSLYIYSDGTSWQIIKYRGQYGTGWVSSTGDWTNRHLGTITVATKTVNANLYTVGELITEETSGNTWRIDSITAGDPGALVVRAISGTGLFTLNKHLAGATSGLTNVTGAQVGAATLLQDGDVLHNLGLDVSKLTICPWWCAAASFTNAWIASITEIPSGGATDLYASTTTALTMHTNDNGFMDYINASGAGQGSINTDAGYYNIAVTAVI